MKIKQLVWKENRTVDGESAFGCGDIEYHVKPHPVGPRFPPRQPGMEYVAWIYTDFGWADDPTSHPSIEAAKSYCQGHYESTVREHLIED